MSFKTRDEVFQFINTTPNAEAPTWVLWGESIEDLGIEFNTQTKERHFIVNKNGSTSTTGHQKQSPVTQLANTEDPSFKLIDDIFFKESVGKDAETDVMWVFPYRTKDVSPFDAKTSKVQIAQGSFSGPAGEEIQYSYDVHYKGDPVFGSVVITDGKPVFTPTETPAA